MHNNSNILTFGKRALKRYQVKFFLLALLHKTFFLQRRCLEEAVVTSSPESQTPASSVACVRRLPWSPSSTRTVAGCCVVSVWAGARGDSVITARCPTATTSRTGKVSAILPCHCYLTFFLANKFDGFNSNNLFFYA